MTYTEEYQEHIVYTFNAYCKIVIYHSAINAARQPHKRCEKEISLEYLTEEKHYPFSALDEYFTIPNPEEYSLNLCGQEVLLNNRTLAAALPRLPEKSRKCYTCVSFRIAPIKKSADGTDATDVQSAYISKMPCDSCRKKWRF